jgi:hypothetical protein
MTDTPECEITNSETRTQIIEYAKIIFHDPNLTWDGLVEACDGPMEYDYGQQLPPLIIDVWPSLPLAARLTALLLGQGFFNSIKE